MALHIDGLTVEKLDSNQSDNAAKASWRTYDHQTDGIEDLEVITKQKKMNVEPRQKVMIIIHKKKGLDRCEILVEHLT